MVCAFRWPDPNPWGCCSSCEKLRNHSPAAHDFSAFLNSRNIPVCLDQTIQTRKPLNISLFLPISSFLFTAVMSACIPPRHLDIKVNSCSFRPIEFTRGNTCSTTATITEQWLILASSKCTGTE